MRFQPLASTLRLWININSNSSKKLWDSTTKQIIQINKAHKNVGKQRKNTVKNKSILRSRNAAASTSWLISFNVHEVLLPAFILCSVTKLLYCSSFLHKIGSVICIHALWWSLCWGLSGLTLIEVIFTNS